MKNKESAIKAIFEEIEALKQVKSSLLEEVKYNFMYRMKFNLAERIAVSEETIRVLSILATLVKEDKLESVEDCKEYYFHLFKMLLNTPIRSEHHYVIEYIAKTKALRSSLQFVFLIAKRRFNDITLFDQYHKHLS